MVFNRLDPTQRASKEENYVFDGGKNRAGMAVLVYSKTKNQTR